MMARKKPVGVKYKIREVRKRKNRVSLTLITAVLVIVVFISAYLVSSVLNRSSNNESQNKILKPKAAIADNLSLTYFNQSFIETATNTLEQAGYAVNYYSGSDVTVEFYKKLPAQNYKVILLRVHSALAENEKPPLALFTSEPYSQAKYVYEQLTDQVTRAYFDTDKDQGYFGILPNFIKLSLNGRFADSIIIMMGCNGLAYTDMAKAFVEKGAKVYIGFNEAVLASYTDQATNHLLEHFLIEKETLKQSVQETFKEIGADPVYKSLLLYYPLEAGSYTIQNVEDNTLTNGIIIKPIEPVYPRVRMNAHTHILSTRIFR